MAQTVARRSKVTNVDRPSAIRIVESMIKKIQRFKSEDEFYNSLPTWITQSDFKRSLRHLLQSNKIIYDKDGSIVWTFIDSPQARKSLEESVTLV
jgi:hypothetical protein